MGLAELPGPFNFKDMKKIFLIALILTTYIVSNAQTFGYLRFDSVKIFKNGGTAELIIESSTKDSTNGVLTNINNGRTRFLRFYQREDSLFLGVNFIAKMGAVKSVATANGISGGTITSIGTLELGVPLNSSGSEFSGDRQINLNSSGLRMNDGIVVLYRSDNRDSTNFDNSDWAEDSYSSFFILKDDIITQKFVTPKNNRFNDKAIYTEQMYYIGDTMNIRNNACCTSFGTIVGSGNTTSMHEFSSGYRKRSGYSGASIVIGGDLPGYAPSIVAARLNANAGGLSISNFIKLTGYHSLFSAIPQTSSRDTVNHLINYLSGQGQYLGRINNLYGYFSQDPFTTTNVAVGTYYPFFQRGTWGRNYFQNGLKLGGDSTYDATDTNIKLWVDGKVKISQADSTSTPNNMMTLNRATGKVEVAAIPAPGEVGTVESVATGFGLTGGPITSTGTISADSSLLTTNLRLQKIVDSLLALERTINFDLPPDYVIESGDTTDVLIRQWALDSLVTSIENDSVTNARLANMAQNTLKGRISSGTGDPEDLTTAQVKTMLEIGRGAEWEIVEDFYSGYLSNNFILFNGNGGTATAVAIYATDQRGNARLSTSNSSASAYAHLVSHDNSFTFNSTTYSIDVKDVVISDLNTTSDSSAYIIGFWDNLFSNGNPADGAYIAYVQTESTWRCVTVSNGTQTVTASSVNVGAGYANSIDLEIKANSTSVEFYIGGVLQATHTTNIPSGTARTFSMGFGVKKKLGTATRTIDVDRIMFRTIN